MPKRDTAILVQDICTALERISTYIHGMDAENFLNDQKTIDAVTRNLEIVGEAARQMDDEAQKTLSRHPMAQDCWIEASNCA